MSSPFISRFYWGGIGESRERLIGKSCGLEPWLYCTGDYGRYSWDGSLTILGRHDAQVKIRGYRIELGEIEAVIQQHPSVTRALVLVGSNAFDDPVLVAFVATRDVLEAPNRYELTRFVGMKLPSYMVPASFIVMDVFPSVANGKVNYAKLRQLTAEAQCEVRPRGIPETATQIAVLEVWKKILAIEAVGLDDDFFQSGGHSLLATQLAARLRSRFEINLPLRMFFEKTTVRAHAAVIDELRERQQNDSLRPQSIQRSARRESHGRM